MIAVSSAKSSYCSGNSFTTWWGSFAFVSQFSLRVRPNIREMTTLMCLSGQWPERHSFPSLGLYLFIYLLIYVCWRLLRTVANKQTFGGHRTLRDWVWNPSWPSRNRVQGRMKAPGEKMSIEADVLRAGRGLAVMIQQTASRTLLKP